MLYIVATPIGNLEDITIRALRVLKEADIIASEDTRETMNLLRHYQISKKLISYYRWNEMERSKEIIDLLLEGKKIALVCDRGTPGISDSAHILVKKAREANIPVVPIPGPSALTSAISVSGFPVNEFGFFGFIPRKSGKKKKFFEALREYKPYIIFFESVHRIEKTLQTLSTMFPEREMCICRELTKKFEEVISAGTNECNSYYKNKKIKGEFVIIMEGNKHVSQVF
ncbi:MAG: 16S rRNA (cytidine(1402)-2'-O)-methyltransferase [Candidatus Omnitrophica bacterium]|nr:16S rRNA (cytidine(1402)-2'-O)-methyltransferase [Candidatus Omnitrophota bacterium]